MKEKLGRVIFRKINGKIIPIRIQNVADGTANASSLSKESHKRILRAILPNGEQVGKMSVSMNKATKRAVIEDVRVERGFQRQGISKNMFGRLTNFLERANFKFLRSDSIQNPAQVKIRSSYGRTRYIGDNFSKKKSNKRIVTEKQAVNFINRNKSGLNKSHDISATTMIKKRKK